MPKYAKQHWSLMFALAGLLALAGGCNSLGWLNFNVVIPLGLDGDVGLLNPFGDGSIFVPPQNGDIEPPLPIQIGDQPGGEPGGQPGGNP